MNSDNLGKYLLFYSHYIKEMAAYYEDDNDLPELQSGPNNSILKKKIDTVGDHACTEAKDFLMAWMEAVEPIFKKEDLKIIQRGSTKSIETYWEIECDVVTSRGRAPKSPLLQVGIVIQQGKDELLTAFPYIWLKGKKEADLILEKYITDPTAHLGTDDLRRWESGSMYFFEAEFLIPTDFRQDYLKSELIKILKKPLEKHIKAIKKIYNEACEI